MATTIKTKNSVTTTVAPTTLQQGELAVNITDKKMWVGNAATTPVQLFGAGADSTFTNISVSGVASFADGTVSLPSITNIGDTNTGMFFPAADTIAFTEGGAEVARFDSSGNFGIGTASPAAQLDVGSHLLLGLANDFLSNSSSCLIARTSAAGTGIFSEAGHLLLQPRSSFGRSIIFATGSTSAAERMRISNTGAVGIGTSSPVYSLNVFDSNQPIIALPNSTTGTTNCFLLRSFSTDGYIDNASTGSIIFRRSSSFTESMRIDSAGNVGIGTSSPNRKLEVTGGSGADTAMIRSSISTDTTYYREFGRNNSSGSFEIRRAQGGAATTDFVIDTSGNVGVGVTPSGNYQLQAGSGSGAAGRGFKLMSVAGGYSGGDYPSIGYNFRTTVTSGSYIYDLNDIAAQVSFSTSGITFNTAASGTAGNAITFSERMRIDSSGNVLVGDTGSTVTSGKLRVLQTTTDSNYISRIQSSAASGMLGLSIYYSGASPNGTGNVFLVCEDTTTTRMAVRSNGGIANYSANDVNLSDAREKTNIELAGSYLNKICSIPVKTFNYIDQNLEDDDGLTLGVIAQDVQTVAPELVMESNWAAKDEPEKMRLSIYQTDLQYALMKSIQELKAELDSVKAELQTLKGK